MSLLATRRAVVALLLLAVAVSFPAAAAKRRAVAHRARPAKVTGALTGRITDAVTGLPVVNARVEAGRSDTTNSNGEFSIPGAFGYGWIEVEISRTGYGTWENRLNGGDQTLNVQLQPGPVVQLRKTDNTTTTLDFDSFKFGFTTGFSRVEAPFEDFCAGGGATVRYDRSEMKRIAGPATYVTASDCCDKAQSLKISIEIKGQAARDFLFADSCSTTNPMSLSARDHVSGEIVYVPFTEVTEIVFP